MTAHSDTPELTELDASVCCKPLLGNNRMQHVLALVTLFLVGVPLCGSLAAWQQPGGAVYVGRCGHSNLPACDQGVDGVDFGWVAVDEPPKGPRPPPPKGDAHTTRNSTVSLHVSIASFRDKLCSRTLTDMFTLAKYPNRLHIG